MQCSAEERERVVPDDETRESDGLSLNVTSRS